MNKNVEKLTNQELLEKLEKSIPNFTENEMLKLLELTMLNIHPHYKEMLLQLSPQETSDMMKRSIRELEQEKKDQQTEWLRKFLSKAQENEEKPTFNCQECQVPIKLSPPDEQGRKVFEFYGKWTGSGHNLVCQNCLENKETK